jgi:hypothetical protein
MGASAEDSTFTGNVIFDVAPISTRLALFLASSFVFLVLHEGNGMRDE